MFNNIQTIIFHSSNQSNLWFFYHKSVRCHACSFTREFSNNNIRITRERKRESLCMEQDSCARKNNRRKVYERYKKKRKRERVSGHEVGVPRLVSTFDFTRELAGIRMGERPMLAGVHEVQWPPVAARPAPSTPEQVNVIPHHPCIVAFLLNRRQSSDPAKIYASYR